LVKFVLLLLDFFDHAVGFLRNLMLLQFLHLGHSLFPHSVVVYFHFLCCFSLGTNFNITLFLIKIHMFDLLLVVFDLSSMLLFKLLSFSLLVGDLSHCLLFLCPGVKKELLDHISVHLDIVTFLLKILKTDFALVLELDKAFHIGNFLEIRVDIS